MLYKNIIYEIIVSLKQNCQKILGIKLGWDNLKRNSKSSLNNTWDSVITWATLVPTIHKPFSFYGMYIKKYLLYNLNLQ